MIKIDEVNQLKPKFDGEINIAKRKRAFQYIVWFGLMIPKDSFLCAYPMELLRMNKLTIRFKIKRILTNKEMRAI